MHASCNSSKAFNFPVNASLNHDVARFGVLIVETKSRLRARDFQKFRYCTEHIELGVIERKLRSCDSLLRYSELGFQLLRK